MNSSSSSSSAMVDLVVDTQVSTEQSLVRNKALSHSLVAPRELTAIRS